jgi:hypothetical protein
MGGPRTLTPQETPMSKYKPLSDRLARHEGDEWRPTVAEIEEVLGFSLPKAAQQAGWWAGAGDKPHHRAWRDHGWQAAGIDKATGLVTFRRETTPEVRPSAIGLASDEAPSVAPKQRRLGAAAMIGAAVAVVAGIGVMGARLLRRR